MAEQRSGQDEPETELIPAVETGDGLASTRQLHAVQADAQADAPAAAPADAPADEPRHQVAPPEPITAATDPARPTAAGPPRSRHPQAPPPLPATPMVLPPAAPSAPPPDAPLVVRRPGRLPLRSGAVGALVVLMLAIIAVAAWKVVPHGGAGGGSPAGSAKALTAVTSSFDPSGGSGLRRDGSAWVTQTYRTAQFGDLKKGVGLVLDLGGSHAVEAVRLSGNGETVQLRAADSRARLADGYVAAGGTTVADGRTTLKGDGGGRHRFWMVWVSRLGQAGGGYSGRISDLTVRGK